MKILRFLRLFIFRIEFRHVEPYDHIRAVKARQFLVDASVLRLLFDNIDLELRIGFDAVLERLIVDRPCLLFISYGCALNDRGRFRSRLVQVTVRDARHSDRGRFFFGRAVRGQRSLIDTRIVATVRIAQRRVVIVGNGSLGSICRIRCHALIRRVARYAAAFRLFLETGSRFRSGAFVLFADTCIIRSCLRFSTGILPFIAGIVGSFLCLGVVTGIFLIVGNRLCAGSSIFTDIAGAAGCADFLCSVVRNRAVGDLSSGDV